MTAKRSTTGGKGSSTQPSSKGRRTPSQGNQNSSKGRSYPRRSSSSKGGGNYSDRDNSSHSKDGNSYSDNEYNQEFSSKGGQTRGDNYNRGSGFKGSSAYRESDSYTGGDSKEGSNYSNDDYNRSSSSKGGNRYSNDSNGNGPSKRDNYSEEHYNESGSKQDDYANDDYNEGSTGGDSGYTKESYGSDTGSNVTSSKGGERYSEDEPVNDPTYEGDDDEMVSKQPHTDTLRNSEKDGSMEEADMTFTEEEVYGEENSTDNQDTSGSTIERVWLWAGGAVPRTAINNSRAAWWTSRVSLGMTDYVIALNDHDFSNGLGIKSNYVNRGERSNRWNPICEILRIADSHEIAPHLMIFLKPIPEMIRDAARVLQEIVEDSSVVPRSIQLDLEGWWTRRSASQRQAGERAIQQYFRDEWRAPRPSLGVGITCIGGVPPAIQGALTQVDFAIPQMYASERNYGRPIRENSVRRHFSRAAEALGNKGKVIAGQTAYSRYVNPEIMKEMLSVLLRLNHQNSGGISEVAYWSDTHLRNSRANREFFQRLTSLVKREGLNLHNIERL